MDSLFKTRSYVDRYAQLIGATILTDAAVNNYNYLLELADGSKYDVLIKNADNISWYNSPLFRESFGSLPAFLQRLLGNYRIASLLGVGPVLRGYHVIDDVVLVLIVDHLEHAVNNDILRDNQQVINLWLEKIHNVGIYHGNLRNENLRMNDKDELRMINFDTMFYRDEKDLPIVMEWMNRKTNRNADDLVNKEQLAFNAN